MKDIMFCSCTGAGGSLCQMYATTRWFSRRWSEISFLPASSFSSSTVGWILLPCILTPASWFIPSRLCVSWFHTNSKFKTCCSTFTFIPKVCSFAKIFFLFLCAHDEKGQTSPYVRPINFFSMLINVAQQCTIIQNWLQKKNEFLIHSFNLVYHKHTVQCKYIFFLFSKNN